MPSRGLPKVGTVVVGAHGQFCDWVFGVVEALGMEPGGRGPVRIDRLDSVDLRANPDAIVLCHYPSRQIVDEIAAGRVSVIFVAEPPALTTRFMLEMLAVQPIEGIRSQTASAIANRAIARNPHVTYVSRTTDKSIGQIVDDIAAHLRYSLLEPERSQLIAKLTAGLGGDASVEAVLARTAGGPGTASGASTAPLDEGVRHIAVETLEPLLDLAFGRAVRPIVWPTTVFKFADQPDTPAPKTAVIAGPVRNLYYGPYFYLPPARYRIEVILAFSDEITEVPFVIEVHGGQWLAKARIHPRLSGRYRGSFVLDHHDATAAVEIRLRNEWPVAEGRLSLIELQFFVEPDAPGI